MRASADEHERESSPGHHSSGTGTSDQYIDRIFVRNTQQALRTRFTTLKAYWQLLERRYERVNASGFQEDAVMDNLRQEFERFEHLLLQYLHTIELHWAQTLEIRSGVDLESLTRDALGRIMRRGLISPQHQFRIDVREPVVGQWDDRWLRDALTHVLTNAVVYMPDGGEVHIVVDRIDDVGRITIHDHGIGIPPDEQELVFQPFYRGRKAETLVPGVGLGLFIASRVVSSHGGSVSLVSQPERGSDIIFSLPITPRDSAIAPA